MERLEELIEALRPLVRSALEAARSARSPSSTDALTALVQLPHKPQRGAVPIVFPLPSELTDEQRAVAEIVALAELPLATTAMPATPEVILRWLGRAPPGPFEIEVQQGERRIPAWRALQESSQDAGWEAQWGAVLEQLPTEEQLDVLVSMDDAAGAYSLFGRQDMAWHSRAVQSLGAEGAKWGRRVLGAAGPRAALREQVAFLAMARAGETIDPAWDAYLPIGVGIPTAIAVECAAALPEDRRDAAVEARLDRTHGHWAIEHALGLAERFDSPMLARFVVETSERSQPSQRKKERAKLVEIAARQPRIRAACAELLPHEEAHAKTPPRAVSAERAAPVTLGRLHLARPRRPFEANIESLSDAERAQLKALVASDVESADFRLEDFFRGRVPDDAPMKWLEAIDVVETETGTVVAELFLYPTGNGAIVHKGTLRMIANIVQHGVTPHATTSKEWMNDFARAWYVGRAGLGLSDPGHFAMEVPED